MTRLTRLALMLSVAATAAGCSAGTGTGGAPTMSPESGTRVAATIDLGGKELLGLAVDDTAVWAVAYQAGSLSKVDPVTQKVVQTVRLDRPAASVLTTAGAVWVASYGGGPADSRLYRLDPATAAVIATVDPGEVCCDLTEGGGAVWAVDPRGSVVGLDPATNAITRRFPVTVDRNAHTNVVYAGGALWVSSDTTKLFRVDPVTGATTGFDVGGGVPFLARDGLVWGAAPTEVWTVDEKSGAVTRRIPLTNSIEVISLEIGFGSVWVGIRRPGRVGAVLRLDQASGRPLAELREIDIPARIAIGFGSVWVTDSGTSSLFRITPA